MAETFGCLSQGSSLRQEPGFSQNHLRGSIVVSISACHAEDPGSIPGRGDLLFRLVVLCVCVCGGSIEGEQTRARRALCIFCELA